MADYSKIPQNASLQLTSCAVTIPDEELEDFKDLLRLSRLGPKTYENLQLDGRFGVSYEWMSAAKSYWEREFDWREHERRINGFPGRMARVVDDDGEEYDVHFVGLFSEKKDARPVMCIHGWPGELFCCVMSGMREMIFLCSFSSWSLLFSLCSTFTTW
jgi:microsomal epoxide hydrolase